MVDLIIADIWPTGSNLSSGVIRTSKRSTSGKADASCLQCTHQTQRELKPVKSVTHAVLHKCSMPSQDRLAPSDRADGTVPVRSCRSKMWKSSPAFGLLFILDLSIRAFPLHPVYLCAQLLRVVRIALDYQLHYLITADLSYKATS